MIAVMTAPRELDGAAVLTTASVSATRATGVTRHFRGGERVNEQIRWLAVCRYEDHPGFYLFYCGEDWTVVTDTFHDTVESALDQAGHEFEGVSFTPLSQSS